MTLLRKPSTYARAALMIALLIGAQFIPFDGTEGAIFQPLWHTALGALVTATLAGVAFTLAMIAIFSFFFALVGVFDQED